MKYLAACCTVKNEEEIISEWMAFHRAAGFEHLIVIDNGSTDRTRAKVKSFKDATSVSYIDWPARDTQTKMYAEVAKEYASRFEWIAFIDADEFLYSPRVDDVRAVLCHFGASAVGVHWLIYGSNGHAKTPDSLNIEAFTRRAESQYISNRHVKSIVRPREVVRPLSSHIFDVRGGFIDEDGRELHRDPPFGFFEGKEVVHEKLRINHYHVRSREEYIKKAKRGYFGVEDDKLGDMARFNHMFAHHDRNDVEDTSALRFRKLLEFYL